MQTSLPPFDAAVYDLTPSTVEEAAGLLGVSPLGLLKALAGQLGELDEVPET